MRIFPGPKSSIRQEPSVDETPQGSQAGGRVRDQKSYMAPPLYYTE